MGEEQARGGLGLYAIIDKTAGNNGEAVEYGADASRGVRSSGCEGDPRNARGRGAGAIEPAAPVPA